MQTTDEIKEWQTQSVKHKVAGVLMMDGVSFRYDEENGITFTAPESYGCSVKPIINEINNHE